MVQVRLTDASASTRNPGLQHNALSLARRLPGLTAAAREVAASVMHGVHGRRRAGVGETFWQFRPFQPGESAARIDWRRSARDDRLYVREREWEAAHNIFVWMDLSPSMAFASALAVQPKIDRALTLGLGVADLLVRGGERVGLLGRSRPRANRDIVERLAQEILLADQRGEAAQELPQAAALAPREQAVLVGDFLSPAPVILDMLEALTSRGGRCHLVMVADPVEESFPFTGHTEFIDVDSSVRLRSGQAQELRALYTTRLAAHREAIRHAAQMRGGSFTVHRTDQPASQALLALSQRLEAGEAR